MPESSRPLTGGQLHGQLDPMILATLEGGEAHGFEVLKRLEAAGCGALKLREGSLYPALYRLEERGCLKSRWEDNPGGRRGPARRVYRLTAKGRRQLQKGRADWATLVAVVGSILGEPA